MMWKMLQAAFQAPRRRWDPKRGSPGGLTGGTHGDDSDTFRWENPTDLVAPNFATHPTKIRKGIGSV